MRFFRGWGLGVLALLALPGALQAAGRCTVTCTGAAPGAVPREAVQGQPNENDAACQERCATVPTPAPPHPRSCAATETCRAVFTADTAAPAASTPATPAPAGGETPPPPTPNRGPVLLQLSQPIGDVTVVNDLGNYIAVVFRYAIGLAGTAAVIMIVYGGFLYLLGSAVDSISTGKQVIQDALIGLMLVLGSYLILATVNPNTLSLKVPDIRPITPVALPADPRINTSNEGCNEDRNCGEGRVCLLHAKENCSGTYCGRCSAGNAGERCRCVGDGCGADRAAYRPGPANNNFQANDADTNFACKSGMRCAAASENFQGRPEYLCIGGSFAVCNMRRQPNVPCSGTGDDWQYCLQAESDVAMEGLCLYGNWRDDTYRRGSGAATFIADEDKGKCTGTIEQSVRNSSTQKCRSGLLCTYAHRPFLDLFASTNRAYPTPLQNSCLDGYNYFRKGCRKDIGASCQSDNECPTRCVNGTCSGFCFLRTGSDWPAGRRVTVTSAGNCQMPEPNLLESACTGSGCGDATWSFVKGYLDFVWESTPEIPGDVPTTLRNRTGNYLAAAATLRLRADSSSTFAHSACFPRRTTGQKCDFPRQCQSGTCARPLPIDLRGVPASLANPVDPALGAGVCQ